MSPTFSDLGVPAEICAALDKRGITTPFPIQAATIADALAGRDVCGRAPTGSGKTLAFGIPLVATVERSRPGHPRAMVLAPTRELAEQIMSELSAIAGRTRVGVVYGGVGYAGQVTALRRGVDLLVACPGRLEDLISQGLVHLDEVDRVVIDEADRMADMGFLPVVRRLLDQTSQPRQTVLFSATLDGDVAQLTRDHQRNPVRHEVGEETPDITVADHVFWLAGATNRTELTVDAVNAVWPAIVFSRTRHGSDRLARQLTQNGIATAAIHGGRSQSQRNRALADFSQGKVQALVATDVAARGIHVDGVAAVIHYDPPEDHKTYIHRSGRTARAGQGGVVLSLVQPHQLKDTNRMQRHVGLAEPMVEPDAAALRARSDAVSPIGGVRRPVPPVPAPESPKRQSGNRDGRARGEADSRPGNRHDRPERRTDGERRPARGGPRSEREDRQTDHRPRPATSGTDDRPRQSNRSAAGDPRPERSGPERDGERARPKRGGLNLTSRTRLSRDGGTAGSSGQGRNGTSAGETRGRRAEGPGRDPAAGRGGAGSRRSGGGDGGTATNGGQRSGTAAGRPSPRAASAGAGARAGTAPARPKASAAPGGRPSSSPNSGGNRKSRRAHLQWS
ncbi:MAG: DEAD/DEAH box helicase [Acidimicrobiia bacterium]|nr:DEAD/DEAH box helicase [Acidimicrobiia bacterium]MDH4365776.1 DEAD/DEAH box helicase [Acidimicrobiia bacterium]MDH5289932.1 DEAD/DEAH box helicase [Acidimicrobiia bacterium]